MAKKHGLNASAEAVTKELQVDELRRAMVKIMKYCQAECLKDDMDKIRAGHPEKSMFGNLVPIIDKDGILRVGGLI